MVSTVGEVGLTVTRQKKSGRQDLNLRPLAPHASALPGCATPRFRSLINFYQEAVTTLLNISVSPLFVKRESLVGGKVFISGLHICRRWTRFHLGNEVRSIPAKVGTLANPSNYLPCCYYSGGSSLNQSPTDTRTIPYSEQVGYLGLQVLSQLEA